MNDDAFLAELRAEVVAAAERVQARRDEAVEHAQAPAPHRSWRWLSAAAAILVVAVVGAVALRPAPASAGVEITYDESGITIRLTDLETRVDEVVDAVRAAGLDITVDEQPVGPSKVGKFVTSSGSGVTPDMLLLGGDGESGFTGVKLPSDFDGELHLTLGRPADDGEEWFAASDATAPGELLGCEDLVDAPLREVLDRVEDAGADEIRVMALDEARWLERDEWEAYASAPMNRVLSVGPGSAWVYVIGDPGAYRPPVTIPAHAC